MKRLQITILERQVVEMDRLIKEGAYTSKSEIIRYALKEMLRVEKAVNQGVFGRPIKIEDWNGTRLQERAVILDKVNLKTDE